MQMKKTFVDKNIKIYEDNLCHCFHGVLFDCLGLIGQEIVSKVGATVFMAYSQTVLVSLAIRL